MKRIIDGQSYNTETSTEVFVIGNPHPSDAWLGLYQTRAGAFFRIEADDNGEETYFGPISDTEAQKLTEKYANHLVEKYFDVVEGGSAERRLTIRLPGNLMRRVEEAALAKNVSVNAYAMRLFESAVTKDGHPPIANESLLRPGRRGKAVSERLRADQERDPPTNTKLEHIIEKYKGILTYEDEPIAHYALIDCETSQFYGPFDTWDDAFGATAKFNSARWEIIDDSGNLRGESGKQNRARKNKAERELAAKRRDEAAKEMHRFVSQRQTEELLKNK